MINPATKTCPEQTEERGPFITTYSGAKFYIDDPNIEDIPIEDIAHALAHNCRFNGHIRKFYSVAEHSVIVSEIVDPKHALWGLLHDVSEAFLPDMPRPFKAVISGFDMYEQKISDAVMRYFGLPLEIPHEVFYIDKNIVADEACVLFDEPPAWIEAYDSVCPMYKFGGLTPEKAKRRFLNRFNELVSIS